MPNRKLRLFELDQPLGSNAFSIYSTELRRLQGNILKGHGRDAEAHLFLTFRPRKGAEAKQFLREFARKITSAAKQQEQTKRHRRSGGSDLFAAVCLSAKGYRRLGFSTAAFSSEFRGGMQTATRRLTDPPPRDWEPKFRKDVHAMVLLAHDNVQELLQQVGLVRAAASACAEVSTELGMKMCDSEGRTIEHFGYVDGRSQPLFFRRDVKRDSLNGRAPKEWDPSAGPKLVVVKDPLGGSDTACGSYYVFRKLEQNVKRFRERVEALADALGLTGADRQRAGALILGRFPDGTPVALSGEALGKKVPRNDFTYAHEDPDGNRCPFAAHIRKTNPRGDFNGQRPEIQRTHRVARRGMPYGDPTPPGDDVNALPETGVGLLFQCYQKDLAEQFEFLQQTWANDKDMARNGTGIDPIIGQSDNGSYPNLKLPTEWGEPGRRRFGFHSFVTMKGGEYFFAPSIPFLRKLK